ncbi:GntR family transcriptional regulator [Paenibacillus aurantius]|uniref:GntR family transcriptional regulator n=1 Tax=Paenibacillus aurantius TaxID=2918900 RepID=A0AA96LH19_9BACL|nr:GntR family transcriptional regulator [Paenibacillus aurantius]WNQ13959.1 GntR family transcriptional regulator [Paenibacillus aurantius]
MPVMGTTLREVAFETIKQKIVNGEWEGGTFLSEKRLSELLGMSKTPIRSAMDRLEMIGLVKLAPNQGVIVQELSLKKIMEIYELRLSLETFAVKQLTGKMDPPFFHRLDENLERQEHCVREEDIVGFVQLDRTFHETIIAGLDNEEYREVMSRLQDKFLMAVRVTFYKNHNRLAGSLNEHKQIRRALEGNDPTAAEELVYHHIEFVKKIML